MHSLKRRKLHLCHFRDRLAQINNVSVSFLILWVFYDNFSHSFSSMLKYSSSSYFFLVIFTYRNLDYMWKC